MLENAGMVRHACNMLLFIGADNIRIEDKKEIRNNCQYMVYYSGKRQEIVIRIPNWYWGEDGLIIEDADEEVVMTSKMFRKFIIDPLGYLESINQQIRRFCWQNHETPKTSPHSYKVLSESELKEWENKYGKTEDVIYKVDSTPL